MELTPAEIRVLGCLVEKQMTTPDIYPLTLNSLVTACNQSTNREPVTSYLPATVSEALLELRAHRKLVRVVLSGAGSRVDKFKHVLDDRLGLTPPESAVLAVLMLRGPQTLGELKIRTERYHDFPTLEAVDAVMDRLCDPTIDADPSEAPIRSDAGMLRPTASLVGGSLMGGPDEQRPEGYRRAWDGPLAVRLGRQPGQKEPRIGHLLGGPIDLDALAAAAASGAPGGGGDHGGSGAGGWRERTAQLESNLDALRADVSGLEALREELATLRAEFEAFRSQFG